MVRTYSFLVEMSSIEISGKTGGNVDEQYGILLLAMSEGIFFLLTIFHLVHTL